MKFEVINRTTEKAFANHKMKMSIKLSENGRIRFNGIAAFETGMQSQLYVIFLRFEKKWFLCVSNDATGYLIHVDKTYRSGAYISAAIITRQIFLDMGVTAPAADFVLHQTEHEHKTSPLFQIIAA